MCEKLSWPNQLSSAARQSTKEDFELTALHQTLTVELTSTHIPTRLAALKWISMLLEKAPEKMDSFICKHTTRLF